MADVTTLTGAQVWLAGAAERIKIFGYIRVDIPTLEAIQKLADERDRYRTATIEVRYAMMNNPGVTPAAFAFLSKVIDEALSPSGDTPAGVGVDHAR